MRDRHLPERLTGLPPRSVAATQRFEEGPPAQRDTRHTAAVSPGRLSWPCAARYLRLRLPTFWAAHRACLNRPPRTISPGSDHSRIDSVQPCAQARFGRWRKGLGNSQRAIPNGSGRFPGQNRLHGPLPSEASSCSGLLSADFSPSRRFAGAAPGALATNWSCEARNSRSGFPPTRLCRLREGHAGTVAKPLGIPVQRCPETSPATGGVALFLGSSTPANPLISEDGVCQASWPRKARGYCLLFHGSARLNSPSRFFPGVHAAGRRSVAKRGPACGGIYRSLSTRELAWDKWVE